MFKEQKRELSHMKELIKEGKTKKIRTRQEDSLTEEAKKAIEAAEEKKKKVRPRG